MVVTIAGILIALTIPAVRTQRRLLASTALMRDVMGQLRYARQLSMSQRQSITFQYNDATKQIRIINQYNNGNPVAACNPAKPRTDIFAQAGFPDTACSVVVLTLPLTQGGLSSSEISYGIPAGSQLPAGSPVIPVTKLDDNIVMTPLNPVSGGKINITFQPDGSVIDAAGIPLDRALFFFNSANTSAAQATASAISVVGASGRIKVWRYTISGNKYDE